MRFFRIKRGGTPACIVLCNSAHDALHRSKRNMSHRTHLPAARMLAALRVRSAGALRITATPAAFPTFCESADRKLVEVAR